ncbi:hypothetical protein [Vibrio phage vB_VhaP_PG11]|nr:hypothetical protein [Vibrio phage vB_VhaP_PG11]
MDTISKAVEQEDLIQDMPNIAQLLLDRWDNDPEFRKDMCSIPNAYQIIYSIQIVRGHLNA